MLPGGGGSMTIPGGIDTVRRRPDHGESPILFEHRAFEKSLPAAGCIPGVAGQGSGWPGLRLCEAPARHAVPGLRKASAPATLQITSSPGAATGMHPGRRSRGVRPTGRSVAARGGWAAGAGEVDLTRRETMRLLRTSACEGQMRMAMKASPCHGRGEVFLLPDPVSQDGRQRHFVSDARPSLKEDVPCWSCPVASVKKS
jgi:hypothetical protein